MRASRIAAFALLYSCAAALLYLATDMHAVETVGTSQYLMEACAVLPSSAEV